MRIKPLDGRLVAVALGQARRAASGSAVDQHGVVTRRAVSDRF
jgi:hypothetical protein